MTIMPTKFQLLTLSGSSDIAILTWSILGRWSALLSPQIAPVNLLPSVNLSKLQEFTLNAPLSLISLLSPFSSLFSLFSKKKGNREIARRGRGKERSRRGRERERKRAGEEESRRGRGYHPRHEKERGDGIIFRRHYFSLSRGRGAREERTPLARQNLFPSREREKREKRSWERGRRGEREKDLLATENFPSREWNLARARERERERERERFWKEGERRRKREERAGREKEEKEENEGKEKEKKEFSSRRKCFRREREEKRSQKS